MTAESQTTVPWKRAACRVAVAVACLFFLSQTDLPKLATPDGQWDFKTYYYAAKTYDAGGNPWDHEALNRAAGGWVPPFIYPPPTLRVFRVFTLDDLATGRAMFLAVKLFAGVALCTLWLICFVRPGARGWFIAFLAVGFNAALARDLASGNVALFEQTLIWFGVYALLHGRPWLFTGLILLAAQFKIMPICLLGLVLLTDSPRKWRCLIVGVLLAGAIAAVVQLSDPREAALFRQASHSTGWGEGGSSVNPSSAGLIGDLVSIIAERMFIADVPQARSVARWSYAVGALAIFAYFIHRIRAARRASSRIDGPSASSDFPADAVGIFLRSRNLIFLGLLTYALLVPRMKDYSYVLLLPAAFEMLRYRLERPGAVRGVILAAGALLALPGTEIFWPYRPLLLAGWAWLIGMESLGKRLNPPASSCSCQPRTAQE